MKFITNLLVSKKNDKTINTNCTRDGHRKNATDKFKKHSIKASSTPKLKGGHTVLDIVAF